MAARRLRHRSGADLFRPADLELHLQGLSTRKLRCLRRFRGGARGGTCAGDLRVARPRGPTLAAAHEVLGDRQAAVCIRLTKGFRYFARLAAELAAAFADKPVKGEWPSSSRANIPSLSVLRPFRASHLLAHFPGRCLGWNHALSGLSSTVCELCRMRPPAAGFLSQRHRGAEKF